MYPPCISGSGGGSQQREVADVVFWPLGRWGLCSIYRHP